MKIFTIAFLSGILAGVLFAPVAGRDVRKKIFRIINYVPEKINVEKNKVAEKIEDTAEKIDNKLEDIYFDKDENM